jgi:hypothetical protein
VRLAGGATWLQWRCLWASPMQACFYERIPSCFAASPRCKQFACLRSFGTSMLIGGISKSVGLRWVCARRMRIVMAVAAVQRVGCQQRRRAWVRARTRRCLHVMR